MFTIVQIKTHNLSLEQTCTIAVSTCYQDVFALPVAGLLTTCYNELLTELACYKLIQQLINKF
jgi:hypothetical protein